MKKMILAIILACSMMVVAAGCGKDTKVNDTTESFTGLTVESSFSIEIEEDTEGGFAP